MHPELTKDLVREQLEEALRIEGLFGQRVQLEEVALPRLFIRFLTPAGKDYLFRFDCANYDFQPIEVELVDPWNRSILPRDAWPRRDGQEHPMHSALGRPFICVEGLRHFYTHEGHYPVVTGKRWELHRIETRLVDLVRFFADRFGNGRWA